MPRPRRARLIAWTAGVFFAADLILWHNAIEQVGAGLATVLGNTQVVLVAVLAWAVLGERPPRAALASIPIVGVGVVLISGVLEEGAYGANPALGAVFGVLTGIAYSGFLLTLREAGGDLRRPAGPLFDATLASAIGCGLYGAVAGDLDLTPSLSATGWLIVLALSSQVFGWLLITISLPRLPAALSSVMLDLPAALRGPVRRAAARRVAVARPAPRCGVHPRRADRRVGDPSDACARTGTELTRSPSYPAARLAAWRKRRRSSRVRSAGTRPAAGSASAPAAARSGAWSRRRRPTCAPRRPAPKPLLRLVDVDAEEATRISTGVPELDRVLGAGSSRRRSSWSAASPASASRRCCSPR